MGKKKDSYENSFFPEILFSFLNNRDLYLSLINQTEVFILLKDINHLINKIVKTEMTQYRFRLTGVPPDQAIKEVDIDPSEKVLNIKKTVQSEFELLTPKGVRFILPNVLYTH